MRFTSPDDAEKWLISIEGWFETRGGDDGEGVVTANKKVGSEVISHGAAFDSRLNGEARKQAIGAARIEACSLLSAHLNGAQE